MNTKLSRFLSWSVSAVILISAGTFGATDALAGDKYRKEYRRHDGQEFRHRELNRDLRRNERERRAFVAGAAAQQHRDDYYRDGGRYRDGYRDRYRDRYYDDDHDDNKIGTALIGVAVGAVVTGAIMSNTNKDNSATSDSR
jgi:hypothetical protein